MKKRVLILLPLLIVYVSLAYALEVETHSVINEQLASRVLDGFSLDNYLKNHLDLKEGKDEFISGQRKKQEIYKFIASGGIYEDLPPWSLPYRRAFNHYHDPISNKGFTGYLGETFFTGESLVAWAQKGIGTQSSGGFYSWKDVRDYFYKALTATSSDSWHYYFSETFRGLGQNMHLVQDASVPSHTRDDAHILFHYELWVNKNIDGLSFPPIFFDKSIFLQPGTNHPISNIFDTNQYAGKNPQITAGIRIGLTEYTNANFFSEETIRSSNFTYPDIKQTEIVRRPYSNILGTNYDREYFLKNCCGETNNDKGYLLSARDLWGYWRGKIPGIGLLPEFPVLDKNVYYDYASLLLPRAVGYSASLMEYFFRGRLDVTSVPFFYQNRLYALQLTIRNATPNENMVGGHFALTYRYTPAGGNPDGSNDVFGQASSILALVGPLVSKDEKGQDFIFFMAGDGIPVESLASLRFTLAYQGTLGLEEKAVIGKVFTPGEIKFNEEWDNGLTGNHVWLHTGDSGPDPNDPEAGYKVNLTDLGWLVKENVRYAGQWKGHLNESFIGVVSTIPDDTYKDVFPIPVTKNT